MNAELITDTYYFDKDIDKHLINQISDWEKFSKFKDTLRYLKKIAKSLTFLKGATSGQCLKYNQAISTRLAQKRKK